MHFVLTGFTQEIGFRVFAFDGIAADRTRTEFTVRTDLSLIRKYGIRVQELPLLCQGVLTQRLEDDPDHALTFTEEGMRVYADHCAAERDAAQKRKSMRRTPTNQNGSGWRAPQAEPQETLG